MRVLVLLDCGRHVVVINVVVFVDLEIAEVVVKDAPVVVDIIVAVVVVVVVVVLMSVEREGVEFEVVEARANQYEGKITKFGSIN